MSATLHNTINWFAGWQGKDGVTLVASIAALAVSLMTYRQKSREGRLAMRKQLTDLLEKLTELHIDLEKARESNPSSSTRYYRLLNDQRRFFTRQADYLISRIRDLVSPYEYLIIAGAFDDINDFEQAEHYFGLAIASAPDEMDRGIALRGFGRYLFGQGKHRHEEARKYFQKAADTFPDTNDRELIYRADTYERWSNLEREWAYNDEALKQLERAINEYARVTHPGRNRTELDRLDKLQSEWKSSGAPPR